MLIDVSRQDTLAIGDLLVEEDRNGYEYYYLIASSGSERVYLIMLNSREGQSVPLVYERYEDIENLNHHCMLKKVSDYSKLALVNKE